MLSLTFCLVVVSWLSVPCNALPGILAPQTSGVDYGPSTAAWTPRPTTFVENVLRRDISPGANSSTSFPPVPTSAIVKVTLSHGANAGIAVGVVVFFFFIIIAPLCLSKRPRKQQISFKPTPKPKVTMSQVQFTSSVATFFALPDGPPRFKDYGIENRFMALLALFGSNGVPLRELIMLASLRMSTKTSHNHWLIDGERGPLRDSIPIKYGEIGYGECSFLAAFTREASTIESIEIFQERLVSLDIINIEYQDLSETLSSAQKCWFMDGRIWRTNQSRSY